MVFIAILVAAAVLGVSDAHFKCNRNIENNKDKNKILELGKLLSLESLAMDICEQSNCSLLDAATGLLGSVGGGGNPLGGIGGGLLQRRRRNLPPPPPPPMTSIAPGVDVTTVGSVGGAVTTVGSVGGAVTGAHVSGAPGSGGAVSSAPGTGVTGGAGGHGGNGGESCDKCGSDGQLWDDVLGKATCLLPGGGNPNNLSPFQTCLIPLILDLNVLDTCDVQAIITKVLKICPKTDLKGVCVSACLCCGKDGETVDACANLCLSSHGIDLNISPLKVLGLDADNVGDSKTPSIGGFDFPNLPLLPQLGLGGGSSDSGSSHNGGGSSSGSGSHSGSGSNSTAASTGAACDTC